MRLIRGMAAIGLLLPLISGCGLELRPGSVPVHGATTPTPTSTLGGGGTPPSENAEGVQGDPSGVVARCHGKSDLGELSVEIAKASEDPSAPLSASFHVPGQKRLTVSPVYESEGYGLRRFVSAIFSLSVSLGAKSGDSYPGQLQLVYAKGPISLVVTCPSDSNP